MRPQFPDAHARHFIAYCHRSSKTIKSSSWILKGTVLLLIESPVRVRPAAVFLRDSFLGRLRDGILQRFTSPKDAVYSFRAGEALSELLESCSDSQAHDIVKPLPGQQIRRGDQPSSYCEDEDRLAR